MYREIKKKKKEKKKERKNTSYILGSQNKLKDVEVASSWLDFLLLLLSGAMDLREG